MCLFSLRDSYFSEKNSSEVSKMSGNGVSPIPDDKILAYIYDDVDDSDIFALESLDTNPANADTKNDDNKESNDIEASEILRENENLKAIVKQLQLEKDMLELRISEVYKTAKAEIERKDRRVQELNEEKNNILFRRNKNFINRQPQHSATNTTKPHPEKELTNEEFQKFNVTYKIPKKNNFDNKDTGQDQKISENLPRPVLEDGEDLKIVSSNERQQDPRKTGHNKDSYSTVRESSTAYEKGSHNIPSRKSSFLGSRSRPRNRSEDRHIKPLRTLSGSPSVKDQYKNNGKMLDNQERKGPLDPTVEGPSDTKERTEVKNGIRYQQRRKSTSEPQVLDLNEDYTKVGRSLRTPSESPPRQNSHYRRSRALCRGRIDEKNKYRPKSEHRGPITPPGSPPRDLRDTLKNISRETNYKSSKTDSKSPHNKEYGNRQTASFKLDQQNEVQSRDDSKKLSKETRIVDIIETGDIHNAVVISKEKECDSQEVGKIKTIDLKRDEERQYSRSKSKEKQTNSQEEVKVKSLNTGKDEERRCRSKSRERDRKHKGSDKILVDNKTRKQLTESDRRPINSRRHSRRSRSRSHEKDNRRQNFRNRSRSKGRYSRRSPERDRYRKNFKEEIPRLGNSSNRNKISSSDRDPVRRERYLGYRNWKNRSRDCPQNMDSRRHNRENRMPLNFNRLREKVLRYSLERAPEALHDVTKTKDRKDLLKGNDTDHSDVEDLRLHLSGASDEISSTEDAKEGKYDNHFELVKDLGQNILQMDDDELERLLQGRIKDLTDACEESEEKMSVDSERAFSDYEENQLTEGEDTEVINKVYLNVDKHSVLEFNEFPVKDEREPIQRNQKANNVEIEDRIMYSENENKTCQQTFKTLFEERQCTRQKVKQNQKVNDKMVRCGNSKENNKGPDKLDSEDKVDSGPQQNVTNTIEAMQHPKTVEKQNEKENNRMISHNKQTKMQEQQDDVQQLEDSKLSSYLNTHALCGETGNSTNTKKSYNSILETIEEAKTKHIDFMLTKTEEKAIKKPYTIAKHQDPPTHSTSAGTLDGKSSPSKEASQYRDPRQNSNSKDLREKSAKEKDACDAHSRQKKVKIGLDVYMKRKKAADAVEVPHSETTTELVPVNDKHIISKSEKNNEMSAEMLLTMPSELDKDVNIVLPDKINNDTSVHPDIQKVAEEVNHPNKTVKIGDPETVNEIKSSSEHSSTNNKGNIILEYSRLVTDEDDENVIIVQENSRESAGDVKDTNSFLHDFSLSEDEDDIQTQHNLLTQNANSDLNKKEKIKILDVTILRPSLSSAPTVNRSMSFIQPESKFDKVVSCALDGPNNFLESPECIEQIQEAVHSRNDDMKQPDHEISHQHDSAEKLDTEELKKCLEDGESGAKDELRMQDKGLTNKPADQKIAKENVNMSDRSGASQSIKTEKQKQEERMLLLFGKSPSPSRPPSSTATEKSNANTEQLKRVKRNLMVEPTQTTKTQNKQNVHKKKTARSKSLDERVFRKPFIEEDELEEKGTEDKSKSFNNGRMTDPVQYPSFCNNPTYIPNHQNPVAFDSPNRYIRKKIDEYKEITGTEIKSEIKHKRNIIPDLCGEENLGKKKCTEKNRKVIAQKATDGSKGLVKKPNEISESEKKKKSKNWTFKIEMSRNQSVKRKGTRNSQECRQTKRKKLHHSSLDSSEEVQSFSSDSEIISVNKNPDGEIRRENRVIAKDKSTKNPTKKSKKNVKRKKSVEMGNTSGKMNTSTESVPVSSSQSDLNISDEKKCEKECKNKLQKKGRKKSINKERDEEEERTGGVEQHCKENLAETGVVLRRGGRIRKEPGFYMPTEDSLSDDSSSEVTCKSNKRRITPIKVGESSNKTSTNSKSTAQNINTSGGNDEAYADSDKSAVNNQKTRLIGPNKRKFHLIDEEAKPEKLPRLDDKGSPEKLDPVPLPNIQKTLKQCEMKICETISDPRVEDVPPISTDVAAIDCGKPSRSFNDSSLPEINLDTKDADLLGTFERGLLENMNDYLCDKSLLSLGSEGKPKSDRDSKNASNEFTKIENSKEGANQVTFSNFLKDNTNTSTPIKISSEAKQNKTANPISTVQIVSSQPQFVLSDNDSRNQTSQGMSNSSSNTVILTKSYLATPLKRDRRRRIGVVMVDVT